MQKDEEPLLQVCEHSHFRAVQTIETLPYETLSVTKIISFKLCQKCQVEHFVTKGVPYGRRFSKCQQVIEVTCECIRDCTSGVQYFYCVE